MAVLIKKLNSACYIYDALFLKIKFLYELGVGLELSEPVDYFLC